MPQVPKQRWWKIFGRGEYDGLDFFTNEDYPSVPEEIAAKEDSIPYLKPTGLLTDYAWRPLSSSASIRILTLEPGRHGDPLVCSLSEGHLDSLLQFRAVSYCCGDLSDRRIVECEGHGVSITKNLYTALVRIRKPDTHERIWADAACINQGDVVERGQQIQLMGRIYRQAGQCLVWLGVETEFDALAFKLLENLATYRRDMNRWQEGDRRQRRKKPPRLKGGRLVGGRDKWKDPSSADKLTIMLFGKERPKDLRAAAQWAALGLLLNRPWFRRVWTLQEIVLPSDAVIMCGPFSIDANVFFDVVEYLGTMDFLPLMDEWHEGQLQALKVASLRERFKARGQNVDLLTALQAARDRDATDLRDKVLGVIGLTHFKKGRQDEVVPVDYRKSVRQTYYDVASFVLTTSADPFRLFKACSLPSSDAEGVGGLPGWVPDWSRKIAFGPVVDAFEQIDSFDAGGKLEGEIEVPKFPDGLPPQQNGIRQLLVVRGKIISSLAEFVQRHSDAQWDAYAAQITRDISKWGRSVKLYFNIGIGWMLELMKGETRTPSAATMEQFFLASCWALTPRSCSVQIFWETMACFLTSGGTTRDGQDAIFTAQCFLEYTMSRNKHDIKNRTQKDFLHSLEFWARDRKFCLTGPEGRIGWVPLVAEKGDVVCIFPGSKLPYVLREASRGTGRSYYLVGHCFIHGIMSGEKAKDETVPWEEIVLQ